MTFRTLPLILLLGCAFACAEPDGDAVEPWRLGTEPDLRIGVVDGAAEYQLDRVTGVVSLSEGAIAVANTGSHEVRVYDADGRLRWRVGGEGSGPGEFRGDLGLARLPGDSLVVYDWLGRRLTVLSPAGHVSGVAAVPDSLPNLDLAGSFEDGTLVFSARHLHLGPGLNTDSVVYHRVAASGEWLGELTWSRGRPVFLAVVDGVPVVDEQPFGPGISVAVGRVLALSYGDTAVLRLTGPDGRSRGRVTWGDGTTGAVTRALVERWAEWSLADARDPRARARWQREVEMPQTLPVSDRLVADDEGRFWVRPWIAPWRRRSPDTVVWKVIDPADGLVAEVPVPIRLEIRAVQNDRVTGVWRNDLDVEFVETYRIFH